MAKTLKDILEVAKPVSPADKAFVAKHTIKKTPDANKNGDDVFNATKTKTYKRSPHHGYDNGADEKVYEEHMTAADKAKEKAIKSKTDKSDMKASMQKQYGPEKGKQVYFATIRKQAMESVEEIDEAQSMADALKNALSKPEPGSKLDHKIKSHNRSIKGGVELNSGHPSLMSKAPSGHHFDKKGMIRLGEAKAATLSALTGKASKIDDYADMIAKFKAKGGAVTKVAAEVPDEKKAASLSATWTRGGGGKGGSSLATGEFASMNKKDAAYNAKQADARKRAAGMKEETELDEASLKYAKVDPKDVKKVLAAHRATGESARHMGDGKIAYSGKKLVAESYEELDEGVSKDHYDIHHKRAMAALNDIGKHLMKQKTMCDKSDNKWIHSDQAWGMKETARQLEDMAHGAAQRTENMTPSPVSQNNIRGY